MNTKKLIFFGRAFLLMKNIGFIFSGDQSPLKEVK
jgi:hypothetical protein